VSRLVFTAMERARMRGYCTGGAGYLAPIGSVGADKKADCSVCSKRVAVTVRGHFAHHKAKRGEP